MMLQDLALVVQHSASVEDAAMTLKYFDLEGYSVEEIWFFSQNAPFRGGEYSDWMQFAEKWIAFNWGKSPIKKSKSNWWYSYRQYLTYEVGGRLVYLDFGPEDEERLIEMGAKFYPTLNCWVRF